MALAIIVAGSVLAGAFGFLEKAQYEPNEYPSTSYGSQPGNKDWWKDTYALIRESR